jgi:hypothetical protein
LEPHLLDRPVDIVKDCQEFDCFLDEDLVRWNLAVFIAVNFPIFV